MAFDGSLASWLCEQPGLLSPQQIATLLCKVAGALQEGHNQQRIHLDINPFNILIHASGENIEQFDVRIAEPGIAAQAPTLFGRSSSSNSLPLYMPPEQWVGRPVFATDQYALAVIAYELLVGLSPFQGSPAHLMDLHLNVQPLAPGTLNQRVSPALDAVILSALAKRPEDRFPSVSSFAHALKQAVHHPESLIVSIPRTTLDGDLHATLTISPAEASAGTLRTLSLPLGRRTIISVPAGVQDGQVIRLEGWGDPAPTGGVPGAVLLTIAVLPTDGSSAPTSASPTLSRSSASASKVYTTIVNRRPRRKVIFLASLLFILLLGGSGLFFLAWIRPSVPMPYPPTTGSLALNDPLSANSGGSSWPDGISTGGGTCQFSQGAYHISMTQSGSFHYCIAGATTFSNFAYEVRMTLLKGDGGGLIFRADGTNGKFYYFRVNRDGSYALYLYTNTSSTQGQTLASGITRFVHTGLNIANVLAVVARGGTFDLYVNNQLIDSVSNNIYSSGQLGLAAAYVTEPTEAVFSDARVWTV
jgi:eukaryotic-like serine/threonine-protein kinase